MIKIRKNFKLILMVLLTQILACTNSSSNTTNIPQPAQKRGPEPIDTISITAAGDIMLGSTHPSSAFLPADDALNSFKNVKPYLKGDIVFANLEGCFLEKGEPQKCNNLHPNSCFAFRMPERYAGIIKDAGFNLLSIANNHIGDFGIRGRRNTTKILDSLNLNYAGLLDHPFSIFEIKGVKFGFCAFAPNANTVSLKNFASAKKLVAELKEKVDIVIVSFHGGAEGAKHEHITRKPEFLFGENRGNVYQFAHSVIDAGADLVLGHGPHVTRAIELYQNKFIAYSLGNFCTYGKFNLNGPNGIAPLVQIKLNRKGNFISANVISTKQNPLKGLEIDSNNLAFKKLVHLTNTDFTDHRFNFDNITNTITPKQ